MYHAKISDHGSSWWQRRSIRPGLHLPGQKFSRYSYVLVGCYEIASFNLNVLVYWILRDVGGNRAEVAFSAD